MDINFLRSDGDLIKRYKREKTWGWLLYIGVFGWFVGLVFTACFEYITDLLSRKCYALCVECTAEQLSAVQFSLKTVLELPYVEFRRLEGRVPGPLFLGSRDALEWLAPRLRAANVPCRVRRVFPRAVKKIEVFEYPRVPDLSVAAAYQDHLHRSGIAAQSKPTYLNL